MSKSLLSLMILLCSFFAAAFSANGQSQYKPEYKSQEVSEIDGVPVLIKHLPGWESVRATAVFTQNVDELRKVFGPQPVFDVIDLSGGGEAVTAAYPAGRLLIVEFTNPQASSDADAKVI